MTEALRLEDIKGSRCPSCRSADAWGLIGRPANRLNSAIVSARCRACGERMFVKKLFSSNDEDGESRATREFEGSSRLFREFGTHPDAGVAKPLGQFGAVLIFEFVDGRPISNVLRSGTLDERRSALRSVGTWFARFHQAASERTGAGDFAEKYGAVAGRCGRGGHLPPMVSAALDHLRDRVIELSNRASAIGRVHGDAKPDNFILSGSRIVGVDIDGHFSNVGEMDLAQFLVQLAIARSNILGSLNEDALQDLEFAFLEGYQRYGALDFDVLNWMTVYFWLSFWISARNRGPLHGLRLNSLFKQQMEICLRPAWQHTILPEGAMNDRTIVESLGRRSTRF